MQRNAINALILCILFVTQIIGQSAPTGREKLSLDKGWKFFQGDIAFPAINGHNATYSSAKAGKAWGAAAPEYNDQKWRTVKLPHDWVVEGGFDSTENVSQGYRKRGIGWYRRHFKLNNSDKGQHLEIQLDGISTHCTIWFNGNIVHRNWSGYTSSYIDITSMARYGEEINTLAIRVDANDMEGWWYEGAGIYRHTWLVKRAPVHIVTDGVFAHPIKINASIWKIPVEINLNNIGQSTDNVEVVATLFDNNNQQITSGKLFQRVNVLKPETVKLDLLTEKPVLWSVDHPVLYKIVTTIKKDNKVIDQLSTNCGFRTIRFDADSGFYLNDQHLKLQGVCNHQDHAGVGIAIPDALWEFRLRKLKEMGVNAYRCSHNPPSNELLDLCDQMGILVMDENRNFNVSPEYMRQLEWMVRRDRNHPSIILWSVFNEEPMQGTYQGYEMVRRMSALVKSMDTTRPVTAAMNGGFFSKENVSQAVDVVGFNYQIGSYDKFHKENPTLKLTSSEDGSAFQVRGEYVNNRAKNILNSYDTEAAPWGATHRNGWKAIAERPYLAGGFYWTGFDYRGEPTPFVWPSAGSFFGIMDLCGFPKMAYWLRQAQWVKDKPVLQLVPHWNWPADSIGKNIKVMSLTNADSVKIILNGKYIASQKVDQYEMNTFMVPYKPGKLEAIGYKNGKPFATFKVETAGVPVKLALIPDRKMLSADGYDATTITVKALDALGREVPTANHPIEFEIKGNGSIIGLGNGDPNSHEPEKGNHRSLFNGLAQLIVQASEMVDTSIELTAKSKGLESAHIVIPVQSVSQIPFVLPIQSSLMLPDWRMSMPDSIKPDPKIVISDNDMNSWMPVKSAETVSFNGKRYALFRTSFTLNDIIPASKGKITLRRITGKAEVWLNNQKIAVKQDFQQGDINVPFESANGKYSLTVLIETETNKNAGLGGSAFVIPML